MAQKYVLHFLWERWMWKIFVILIFTTSLDCRFICSKCVCQGFTHLDKIPHIQSLFLGCARITNPTTLVRQDGEMGDVAANLVSVMHPEWRSREKNGIKEETVISLFPAQLTVSHFTWQQKRSLAVHSSRSLGSPCSSMITNWPFCVRHGGWVASSIYPVHVFVLQVDAERQKRRPWVELHRVDTKYSNCVFMSQIKAGLSVRKFYCGDSHIMMWKTEKKTCRELLNSLRFISSLELQPDCCARRECRPLSSSTISNYNHANISTPFRFKLLKWILTLLCACEYLKGKKTTTIKLCNHLLPKHSTGNKHNHPVHVCC